MAYYCKPLDVSFKLHLKAVALKILRSLEAEVGAQPYELRLPKLNVVTPCLSGANGEIFDVDFGSFPATKQEFLCVQTT
jgi:hypothetical protein